MAGMARKGDIEKVKELIGKGANIDSRDKKHNATALMWAAHEGHIEILNYLIANRAAIEASKPTGQTSLWFAAQKGQLEAAEILIKNGANVNVVTKEGVTALMIAKQNSHQEIVTLLSKKK
jgi:ankyrin repeat protein